VVRGARRRSPLEARVQRPRGAVADKPERADLDKLDKYNLSLNFIIQNNLQLIFPVLIYFTKFRQQLFTAHTNKI
jgi:hypothetical protein